MTGIGIRNVAGFFGPKTIVLASFSFTDPFITFGLYICFSGQNLPRENNHIYYLQREFP
jgi:hypothetical protein